LHALYATLSYVVKVPYSSVITGCPLHYHWLLQIGNKHQPEFLNPSLYYNAEFFFLFSQ